MTLLKCNVPLSLVAMLRLSTSIVDSIDDEPLQTNTSIFNHDVLMLSVEEVEEHIREVVEMQKILNEASLKAELYSHHMEIGRCKGIGVDCHSFALVLSCIINTPCYTPYCPPSFSVRPTPLSFYTCINRSLSFYCSSFYRFIVLSQSTRMRSELSSKPTTAKCSTNVTNSIQYGMSWMRGCGILPQRWSRRIWIDRKWWRSWRTDMSISWLNKWIGTTYFCK